MKNSNQADSRSNVSSTVPLPLGEGRGGALGLLFHYLKIASRNLWKYKTQSLVNIFGLAFGFTCFVFGIFWIKYETSYNSFFPGANRMYILAEKNDEFEFPVMSINNLSSVEQVPEFEKFTWQAPNVGSNYSYNDRTFYAWSSDVSPDFFDFFVWDFIEGDVTSFSQTPGSIVITQRLARKYFGDEPAVGKALDDNGKPVTITGVIKDWPANCTFDFDIMVCQGIWGWRANIYILASREANMEQVSEKFSQIFVKSLYKRDKESSLLIKPIGSLHYKYFNQNMAYGINFITIFFAAGLLALASAIFNYITISSSALLSRSRETSLRKTVGASQGDLAKLFLTDILFTAVIAFAVSFLLVTAFRPVFSQFSNIPLAGINHLWLQTVSAGLLLLLLVSIYPVVRLNRQSIARAFGSERKIGARASLRRIMIVLQLLIASLLMFVSLTIFRQIQMMKNTDTGIDVNNVMMMEPLWEIKDDVKEVIAALPYVEQTIVASWEEPLDNRHVGEPDYSSSLADRKFALSSLSIVDPAFFDFFRYRLVKGRFFEPHEGTYCVINQTAAKLLGDTDIVGSRLSKGDHDWEIAGVVQDTHSDFHNEITPVIYFNNILVVDHHIRYCYSRIMPQYRQKAITELTDIVLNGKEPEGTGAPCVWLDDELAHKRKEESAMFLLFGILALACTGISMFGIYSLSSFTTRKRRKEVAIRKVAGAEAINIAGMFIREYIWLVLIANLIAVPLGYWLMNRWLHEYAYHVNIAPWLFAVVFAAIAAIVLFTVLGQVMKAANSDPAEVVKHE